jgi:hypothetical protein
MSIMNKNTRPVTGRAYDVMETLYGGANLNMSAEDVVLEERQLLGKESYIQEDHHNYDETRDYMDDVTDDHNNQDEDDNYDADYYYEDHYDYDSGAERYDSDADVERPADFIIKEDTHNQNKNPTGHIVGFKDMRRDHRRQMRQAERISAAATLERTKELQLDQQRLIGMDPFFTYKESQYLLKLPATLVNYNARPFITSGQIPSDTKFFRSAFPKNKGKVFQLTKTLLRKLLKFLKFYQAEKDLKISVYPTRGRKIVKKVKKPFANVAITQSLVDNANSNDQFAKTIHSFKNNHKIASALSGNSGSWTNGDDLPPLPLCYDFRIKDFHIFTRNTWILTNRLKMAVFVGCIMLLISLNFENPFNNTPDSHNYFDFYQLLNKIETFYRPNLPNVYIILEYIQFRFEAISSFDDSHVLHSYFMQMETLTDNCKYCIQFMNEDLPSIYCRETGVSQLLPVDSEFSFHFQVIIDFYTSIKQQIDTRSFDIAPVIILNPNDPLVGITLQGDESVVTSQLNSNNDDPLVASQLNGNNGSWTNTDDMEKNDSNKRINKECNSNKLSKNDSGKTKTGSGAKICKFGDKCRDKNNCKFEHKEEIDQKLKEINKDENPDEKDKDSTTYPIIVLSQDHPYCWTPMGFGQKMEEEVEESVNSSSQPPKEYVLANGCKYVNTIKAGNTATGICDFGFIKKGKYQCIATSIIVTQGIHQFNARKNTKMVCAHQYIIFVPYLQELNTWFYTPDSLSNRNFQKRSGVVKYPTLPIMILESTYNYFLVTREIANAENTQSNLLFSDNINQFPTHNIGECQLAYEQIVKSMKERTTLRIHDRVKIVGQIHPGLDYVNNERFKIKTKGWNEETNTFNTIKDTYGYFVTTYFRFSGGTLPFYYSIHPDNIKPALARLLKLRCKNQNDEDDLNRSHDTYFSKIAMRFAFSLGFMNSIVDLIVPNNFAGTIVANMLVVLSKEIKQESIYEDHSWFFDQETFRQWFAMRPHIKRIEKMQIMDDWSNGKLSIDFNDTISLKLKKEPSKPSLVNGAYKPKAPRLFASYGARCMFMPYIFEILKKKIHGIWNVYSNYRVEHSNIILPGLLNINVVTNTQAQTIKDVFTQGWRFFRGYGKSSKYIAIYGDDKVSVVTGFVKNEDIKMNDMSNGYGIFELMRQFLHSFLPAAQVNNFIDAHKQTLKLGNPHNKAEWIKFKPLWHVMGSGSTLTTFMNILASLSIISSFFTMGIQDDSTESEAGYLLTGDIHDNFSKIQFLCRTAYIVDDEAYHTICYGTLFKSFGTISNTFSSIQFPNISHSDFKDMMSRGNEISAGEVELMEIFFGSIIDGYKNEPSSRVLRALRTRFSKTGAIIEKGFLYVDPQGSNDDLEQPDIPDVFFLDRYDLNVDDLEELVNQILTMRVGDWQVSKAVCQFLAVDYGYPAWDNVNIE